ncbi:DUF4291 family protein [Fodinicola feengrottensis]|uniref:DUF4291 family protein n=1 Tax=Fodinicola feengrottensis TaxID=435914 RepID=UPI0036F2CDF2
MDQIPARQVRAAYDDDTIIVYQAYASAIAEPAVTAQAFVPPFKIERMTWIKPSFLWMMYRCGWATKTGSGTGAGNPARPAVFRSMSHKCDFESLRP